MALGLWCVLLFVFSASGPCSGSYYVDDEVVLQELLMEYDGYYAALGQKCEFLEYLEKVEPFWKDFFNYRKSHTSKHYDLVFNHEYSDIYVYFNDEVGETDKTIYRYQQPRDLENARIIPIRVIKATQRQLEISRCFTGEGRKLKCTTLLSIC